MLAGISLAEADVLRKAVGKKDAELIDEELGKFVEKARRARPRPKKIIEELAGQIETFGRYGFNKSHAVAYSVISYQTAWLKAHYPAEFMAALLSSSIGDTDSVVKYINEARELGHRGPAARRERVGLQVHRRRRQADPLRPGRDPQRGRRARSTRSSRRAPTTARSPIASSTSCDRVDLRVCNKRVFEALIASGALDGLGGHRAQYLRGARRARSQEASLKQAERPPARARCSATLGRAARAGHPAAPHPAQRGADGREAERLAKEKELLGFYISGHPLEPFRAECELFATHTVAELGTWTRPSAIARPRSSRPSSGRSPRRAGAEFARLTVEDFSGSSEVLVFPEAWGMLGDRVQDRRARACSRAATRSGTRATENRDLHRRVGHASSPSCASRARSPCRIELRRTSRSSAGARCDDVRAVAAHRRRTRARRRSKSGGTTATASTRTVPVASLQARG